MVAGGDNDLSHDRERGRGRGMVRAGRREGVSIGGLQHRPRYRFIQTFIRHIIISAVITILNIKGNLAHTFNEDNCLQINQLHSL